MSVWTLIAVGFCALFTVLSLLNRRKDVAVFVFLAALLCDIYLAYFQQTGMPDLIRFMFLFLAIFQLFLFVGVLLSKPRSNRGYR